MTWTYSGDPGASELDAVRFDIGDTDSTDQLLQDEELNYLILQEDNEKYAAAAACERIAARFARQVQKSVGPLQLQAQQKFQQYRDLAATLRGMAGSPPLPFAGGISISDKQNRDLDTDVNQGAFRSDLMESVPASPHVVDEGPILGGNIYGAQ